MADKKSGIVLYVIGAIVLGVAIAANNIPISNAGAAFFIVGAIWQKEP